MKGLCQAVAVVNATCHREQSILSDVVNKHIQRTTFRHRFTCPPSNLQFLQNLRLFHWRYTVSRMSSSGNDDMVLWTIEELREQVDAHKREDKKRQAANRSRLEEWDAIIAQMPEPRAREKQGQDQEGEEEEEVEGQETTLSSRRLSLRSSS